MLGSTVASGPASAFRPPVPVVAAPPPPPWPADPPEVLSAVAPAAHPLSNDASDKTRAPCEQHAPPRIDHLRAATPSLVVRGASIPICLVFRLKYRNFRSSRSSQARRIVSPSTVLA